MEEHPLVGWLYSLFSLLSYTAQNHVPRSSSTAHSELRPPTWIINQENAPHLPTGQSNGGNSSTEGPYSQMMQVCANLTKANHLTSLWYSTTHRQVFSSQLT